MKQFKKLIEESRGRYRNVPGYCTYDLYLDNVYRLYRESAENIVSHVGGSVNDFDLDFFRSMERDIRFGDGVAKRFERHDYLLIQSIEDSFPVYHVNKDLAESLSQTDIPLDIPVTHLFQRRGVVLFPTPEPGSGDVAMLIFSYSPEDDLIDVLTVHSQVELKELDFEVSGKTLPRCIFLFRPGVSLNALNGHTEGKRLRVTVDSYNTVFSVNVVYNLFLYLQQQPQDFTEIPDHQTTARTRGLGFGTGEKRLQKPVMIGYNHRVKTNNESLGGNHASPQSHWRRGHWRNQPYGDRQKPSFKPIWIEPTFING